MKLRMILILALALGTFGQAHAAADEAAQIWLEKLFGLVDSQGVRAEYVVTAKGMEDGMAIEATMRGELLQASESLYTNSIEMEIKAPAMGDQPMAVTSRQICDGTTVWAETFVSAMGITQVGKIALSDLQKIQAAKGELELGQSTLFMSPMSMLESLVEAFDITVLEIAGGKVSLSLTPTEEAVAKLGADGGLDQTSGILELREADATPIAAHVSMSSEMDVVISFQVFETIVVGDIPEGTFSYTPEPGAQIIDLAPLLKSGM